MPDTENEVQGNDVQQELMDMIIADESPATISDRIKDMLFAKSAERVDNFKPDVAADTFGSEEEVAAAAVADAAANISGEVAAEIDAEAPDEE